MTRQIIYENTSIMFMDDFNVNLKNHNEYRNISIFFDAMLSHSFLLFITTLTRITRNSKTLMYNILNKPPDGIMSGHISSISDHFIQLLIEPSHFTIKSLHMVYRKSYYKYFNKLQFRADSLKLNGTVFAMILIQM